MKTISKPLNLNYAKSQYTVALQHHYDVRRMVLFHNYIIWTQNIENFMFNRILNL